jgi:hypothetical protein
MCLEVEFLRQPVHLYPFNDTTKGEDTSTELLVKNIADCMRSLRYQ